MKYVHIKNLDKYHPGYRDRELKWCKTFFSMVNSDPEFEMVPEIDKWRFVALIMLELQVKKPVPLDQAYLQRKGFNFKNRSMSLTLQMLHNFVEVCEEPSRVRNVDIDAVTEREKDRNGETRKTVTDEEWMASLRKDPTYSHVNFDHEIGKAKRWLETRPGRKFTRRFFVNWINKIEKPIGAPKREATRLCSPCGKEIPSAQFYEHNKKCLEDFYANNPRGPLAPAVDALVKGVAENLTAKK